MTDIIHCSVVNNNNNNTNNNGVPMAGMGPNRRTGDISRLSVEICQTQTAK